MALAAAFVVAWAGCMSLQPSAAMPEQVARVAVANYTEDTWEIAVRSARQGEVRREKVAPRSMAQLNLSGGDYVIEQTLIGEAPSASGVRRFPARFAAGQDYTWSLAALRTTDASVSEPAPL